MRGFIDLFIPREKRFLEFLSQQSQLVCDCFTSLPDYTETPKVNATDLKRSLITVQKNRERVDSFSNEIIRSLHLTFITPIDREELQALTLALVRIMDSLEKIVEALAYFKISRVDGSAQTLWELLGQSLVALNQLLRHPLKKRENDVFIQRIQRYEKAADATYRLALRSLFSNGHATMTLFKKRELYTLLEEAIDEIKHATDLLELVLITHA